jgi:hypothetical protein
VHYSVLEIFAKCNSMLAWNHPKKLAPAISLGIEEVDACVTTAANP